MLVVRGDMLLRVGHSVILLKDVAVGIGISALGDVKGALEGALPRCPGRWLPGC